MTTISIEASPTELALILSALDDKSLRDQPDSQTVADLRESLAELQRANWKYAKNNSDRYARTFGNAAWSRGQ